jgi:hypothetical protein
MRKGPWSLACSVLLSAVLAAACGGSSVKTKKLSLGDFDPHAHLLAFAENRTAIMKAPEESLELLEDQLVPGVKGASRRALERKIAVATFRAAESEADPKAQKKARNSALRLAEKSKKAESDAYAAAESEFLALWIAWRAEKPSARSLAAAFTSARADTLELYALAWAIRGELALEYKDWDDAKTAFRSLLGDITHPLYAYALYRTASAHEGAGEEEEQKQALLEATQMGCDRGAAAESLAIALLAASELGERGRKDKDGVTRPASCPVGGRKRSIDDLP